MKQYLYILLCTVLLAGCTDNQFAEQGTPADEKTITATFTLASELVEEITVRSVDGVDERAITNVWVIQLAPDGMSQLQAPQYITSLTTGARDYKVSVSLQRSASKVYFIANTNDNAAYTGVDTETKVLAVTRTIATETDLLGTPKNIPMAGMWSGTPDLLGIAGQVSLSRAVAKVNFTLNASLPGNERFTLKSVTVKQVPNSLQYYRSTSQAAPYPALTGTGQTINYSEKAYDKQLTSTAESLWWYLPENARGTGSATIQTDKAINFPTDQAAYCTYIEVAGRYEAAGGTYNTTYKIYLGANNTNDYNLKRNTVYNVNTTIKGIDAADTRINTLEKSIIIGMFGGWDETTKQYTKLLEVQSVETTKDLEFIWSKDQTVTGATNIHYGVTNIEILKGLNSDLSNYPAAKHCVDLGNGWYLPSQNQLMAIWVTYLSVPSDFLLQTNTYWSSLEDTYENSRYFSFSNISASNAAKNSKGRVRCVRDIDVTNNGSPKVLLDANNRIIIDSRILPSQVITVTPKARTTKATNKDATTDNTVSDIASEESNKTISYYFEVAKQDVSSSKKTWRDAISDCESWAEDGGNWRLPTQRELMLIWISYSTINAKKISGFTQFIASQYWSASEMYSTNGHYTFFTNGYSTSGDKMNTYYVRCVRDITPPEK